MPAKGFVAAGDPNTAGAAAGVLADGGNAFDAVLAALCTACVAEPVLASLGGGGFLLARRAGGRPVLYDFFVQTPLEPRPAAETDFYSAFADFGTTRQEFHIGLGSVAVPGIVKGLFSVHRDLGSQPMRDIVAPAATLAREGVAIEPLQANILSVVAAIYTATPASRAIFASRREQDGLMRAGETLRIPEFADALEALADEGEALFYRGDIAKRIVDDCHDQGGHLTLEDLERYAVIRRRPLERSYRGNRLMTNPPPSSGGVLIAFALDLLERADVARHGFGSTDHLDLLARVMAQTNRARVETRLHDLPESQVVATVLDPQLLATYAEAVLGHPASARGTTHISVVDRIGNAAALSISNGEGSAYVVPGTGIMLNNILGEEDVNPHGFHNWPPAMRVSSMMSPTLIETADGRTFALGSGGSNRIRTAILQVLVNLIDFKMDAGAAVRSPRIHFEEDMVHVEHGFDAAELEAFRANVPEAKVWPETHMFFGGVHVAMTDAQHTTFAGAGDPRRGGVTVTV